MKKRLCSFWELNKNSVIEKSFNLIFLSLFLEKLGVFNNYAPIFFISEMHVIVLGKLDMFLKGANTDKSHWLSF